ncbi:hypothetical protein [Nocardioides alkalitolerans]|uniref:hypothetical protein n=1 Tax=Nocardioides alkalitolerans TaxID=281714 RepID=UPI00069460F7|nr:hypothetical protein [Nocardioides alkalitolerans]
MTGEQPVVAAEVYTLELVAVRRPWWRRVTFAVGVLIGGLLNGTVLPSRGDIVVRRKDDGSEVLRMDAGADPEAERLLQHVHDHLHHLDVRTFHESWGVAPPG